MSSNDYIAKLAEKQPHLFVADKTIQMKSIEFRKQLQQAFEAGKLAGRKTQSVFAKIFGEY